MRWSPQPLPVIAVDVSHLAQPHMNRQWTHRRSGLVAHNQPSYPELDPLLRWHPNSEVTSPSFDVTRFETACLKSRVELDLLIEAGAIPDPSSLYDPRLDIVHELLLAAGAGRLPYATLWASLADELATLRDTPHAALLASEFAKHGLLELGRLSEAAACAREAARVLADLKQATQAATQEIVDAAPPPTV